ncbi:Regulator of sigma E protease [Weissella viridescens]|uniref:Regulator of sigma E protease n=1 Tax=Weissella viridescens TaxID=1629 RepID=A0A380P851_WEIVI|nr:Regulator of sigma E protease [Weissella viridescens]
MLTIILFVGVAFALPGVTTTNLDHVQNHSAAMQAGLKSGDQIEKIDGKPVKSWQAMQTQVQMSTSKNLTVTYQRAGKVMKQLLHRRLRPFKVKKSDKSG